MENLFINSINENFIKIIVSISDYTSKRYIFYLGCGRTL